MLKEKWINSKDQGNFLKQIYLFLTLVHALFDYKVTCKNQQCKIKKSRWKKK